MQFSEKSRVKIPAIVHLTRLGYRYYSLNDCKDTIDEETNIFVNLFRESINRVNSANYSVAEAKKLIGEISILLENNDLGEAFYKALLGDFSCKLIDFEIFENNSFHLVTELTYKNGEDEFRPDITVLINGMPLFFIEVKKPNNREGILAERNRINTRFKNKKFKKFINITQLIIFSNNMEYDEESVVPIQGAFYASSSYTDAFFNCFREEDHSIHYSVGVEDKKQESYILQDTNLVSIFGTQEYETNKKIDTPTNRIITSIFSKARLKMILKYAFTYVRRTDKNGITTLEKHIMRYPQLFATLAIEHNLARNIDKGIIWHTQGSGKTALAYFNVRYLRDYFQKEGKIVKFYFIVDRLDLMTQASDEFKARGLHVEMVNSKEDFVNNIKTSGTSAGSTGKDTIAVVNIQKYSEESITSKSDYDINVQRVYFLDEAHRSYNPNGSFLANLFASDRNAIMIALTGTPLVINKDYKSKDIFGDYYHKYYYNQSIADGYTLKLIREEIETTYRTQMQEVWNRIETEQGSISKATVYAHDSFVSVMTNFIIDDFIKSRKIYNDDTVGGMIVCDSSDQARKIHKFLQKTGLSSALILYDEADKDTRRELQNDFKEGKIDLFVVYNMLLTGFDSSRLKKLYLCRVVKAHNLLQTLTRVNRPYNDFRYGYVVDFADIRSEFDKTNRAYFEELQSELGDEFKNYDNIFKSQEEIEKEILEIKDKLFLYDFTNLEEFTQTISNIKDKKELLELRRCLENLKSLYNLIKIFGYTNLIEKIPYDRLNILNREVQNCIDLINLKESLESSTDNAGLLALAFDKIEFHFRKISESELVIADKFRSEMERTRREMEKCIDKKDSIFISLYEELKRIFKKKHIEEFTSEEMAASIQELEQIYIKISEQNRKDAMLAAKYGNDAKFTRLHKRIKTNELSFGSDTTINNVLLEIKHKADEGISNNHSILNNEAYFKKWLAPFIFKACEKNTVHLSLDQATVVNTYISNEYLEERILAS
ncbi:type I restriction endonuclease [Chloroflexota bacterium]